MRQQQSAKNTVCRLRDVGYFMKASNQFQSYVQAALQCNVLYQIKLPSFIVVFIKTCENRTHNFITSHAYELTCRINNNNEPRIRTESHKALMKI